MTSPKSETRRAVSAAIRRGSLVLAVRRPDAPGEELPGVWGLPAATLRPGETSQDALRRLGGDKLGVRLEPGRALAQGEQQRDVYLLHMTVYEARIDGEPALPAPSDSGDVTHYDALDWLPASAFREAADRGSLCCRLFLHSKGQSSAPSSC